MFFSVRVFLNEICILAVVSLQMVGVEGKTARGLVSFKARGLLTFKVFSLIINVINAY